MLKQRFVPLVLALAVAGISTGGVLAVLAQEADPGVVAMWRTGLCGALLLPFARRFGGRDLAWTLLGGVLLAGHFWTWLASLQHIEVMRSVVLVTLAPLWVGLGEWGLGGRRARLPFWLGVLLALTGVALMGWAELGSGSWRGDGLALVGGVLNSAYLLVTREVRQRVDFASFGSSICLAAAFTLLVGALVGGAPLVGFELGTWSAVVAMALVPQLLGHVGFQLALGHVPATRVAALVLLEPVGATLLAWLALGQVPGALELLGGAVVIAGVGVASRGVER